MDNEDFSMILDQGFAGAIGIAVSHFFERPWYDDAFGSSYQQAADQVPELRAAIEVLEGEGLGPSSVMVTTVLLGHIHPDHKVSAAESLAEVFTLGRDTNVGDGLDAFVHDAGWRARALLEEHGVSRRGM